MNHLPSFEDINLTVGYYEGSPINHLITAEEQRNAYFEYGLTPDDLMEMELKYVAL